MAGMCLRCFLQFRAFLKIKLNRRLEVTGKFKFKCLICQVRQVHCVTGSVHLPLTLLVSDTRAAADPSGEPQPLCAGLGIPFSWQHTHESQRTAAGVGCLLRRSFLWGHLGICSDAGICCLFHFSLAMYHFSIKEQNLTPTLLSCMTEKITSP